MADWVFFDVGSVLFNDDPQNFRFYEYVHHCLGQAGINRTFDCLMQERELRVKGGEQWISRKILEENLSPEQTRQFFTDLYAELRENYDLNHIMQDNLHDHLEKLRSQFKLGIIANQSTECRTSLERRGLIEFFDVVAISDELDLHKPDPELYRWALQQAGILGSQAIMIGDRLDNDIAPASEVGMHSVYINWKSWKDKNWVPHNDHAKVYLDSCERVPMFQFQTLSNQPTHEVQTFAQAIDQLLAWSLPATRQPTKIIT
jgi:HAD superfamily hydrolase (TIGR01549 family)